MKIKIELDESDFFNWEPQAAELVNQYDSPIFCARQLYNDFKNNYRMSSTTITHADKNVYLSADFWEELYNLHNETPKDKSNFLLGALLDSDFLRVLNKLDLGENTAFKNFVRKWAQDDPVDAVSIMCSVSPDFRHTYYQYFADSIRSLTDNLARSRFDNLSDFKQELKKALDTKLSYNEQNQKLEKSKNNGDFYILPTLNGKTLSPVSYETVVEILDFLPQNRIYDLFKLDLSRYQNPNIQEQTEFVELVKEDIRSLYKTTDNYKIDRLQRLLGVSPFSMMVLACVLLEENHRESLLAYMINIAPAHKNDQEQSLIKQFLLLKEKTPENYLKYVCKNCEEGIFFPYVATNLLRFILLNSIAEEQVAPEVLRKSLEIMIEESSNTKYPNSSFFKPDTPIGIQCATILNETTPENLSWLKTQLNKNVFLFRFLELDTLEALNPQDELLGNIFSAATSTDKWLPFLPKSWFTIENIKKFEEQLDFSTRYEEINKKSGVLKNEDFVLFLIENKAKKDTYYQKACEFAINKYAMLAKNKEVLAQFVSVAGASSIYTLEVLPGNKLTEDPEYMARLIKLEPDNYLLSSAKNSELWKSPIFTLAALEVVERKFQDVYRIDSYHKYIPTEVLSFIGTTSNTQALMSKIYKEKMRTVLDENLASKDSEVVKKPKRKM